MRKRKDIFIFSILTVFLSLCLYSVVYYIYFATPVQNESKELSFDEYYKFQLLKELKKRAKRKLILPPYELIKIHEEKASKISKLGYSTNTIDTIFKRWMKMRYGINYNRDRIFKINNKYEISLKRKRVEPYHVIDKEQGVFIIPVKKVSSEKHLKNIESIMLPKYENIKYTVKSLSNNKFEVRPIWVNSN